MTPHKCLKVSKCRIPTSNLPRREDDNLNNTKVHHKRMFLQAGAQAQQPPPPNNVSASQRDARADAAAKAAACQPLSVSHILLQVDHPPRLTHKNSDLEPQWRSVFVGGNVAAQMGCQRGTPYPDDWTTP
ncbi:unnamed protein product [Pleuronectes platessa]|uniref:Uncharacterized protein n=1 Tax=Pleuronectes platessa TaxID=8262 RepID=A0A9N7VLM3_PLEPL|nr:unnamed protein product [Pleuronectes platessa]